MQDLRPFHLAFGVPNIHKIRYFYKDILGCKEGRSTDTWIDFNFFGHQLVFHLEAESNIRFNFNDVDDKKVPLPHFGIILKFDDWLKLSNNLKSHEISFLVQPYTRFKDQKGEQGTFFFYDPNGLALEFKYFKSDKDIFDY